MLVVLSHLLLRLGLEGLVVDLVDVEENLAVEFDVVDVSEDAGELDERGVGLVVPADEDTAEVLGLDIGEIRAEPVSHEEFLEAGVVFADGEFREFLVEWLVVVVLFALDDVADDGLALPVEVLDGEDLGVDDLGLRAGVVVDLGGVLRVEEVVRVVVHLNMLVLGENLEVDVVLVEGAILGAPVRDLDLESLEFGVLGGDIGNA